jgi:hypothetical protein
MEVHMKLRATVTTLVFTLLAALPAWAGPPLICHPNQIGSAQSLPWQTTSGWNGMESSYDVSHLVADTLTLLTPATPIIVREETLRRAAIYSSRQSGLADRLSSRLLARTLDKQNEPTVWFDAGYFTEAVREATFPYMKLHDPAQLAAWKLRTDSQNLDGAALIRKAIRLGGQHMDQAAAVVEAAQKRL